MCMCYIYMCMLLHAFVCMCYANLYVLYMYVLCVIWVVCYVYCMHVYVHVFMCACVICMGALCVYVDYMFVYGILIEYGFWCRTAWVQILSLFLAVWPQATYPASYHQSCSVYLTPGVSQGLVHIHQGLLLLHLCHDHQGLPHLPQLSFVVIILRSSDCGSWLTGRQGNIVGGQVLKLSWDPSEFKCTW